MLWESSAVVETENQLYVAVVDLRDRSADLEAPLMCGYL